MTSPDIVTRRKPVFGTVSACAPFVGVAISVATLWDGMMAQTFYLVTIIILSVCFVGAVSGLVALARRERYWGAALTAVVVNCTPILYVLVFKRS
jgi:hypothetical protein